jgi:hypothetical protein
MPLRHASNSDARSQADLSMIGQCMICCVAISVVAPMVSVFAVLRLLPMVWEHALMIVDVSYAQLAKRVVMARENVDYVH